MLTIALSLLALSSAARHIQAEFRGPVSQVYLFKPLTTTAIILIALLGTDPPTTLYKWALVAGLIFSLGGDVFLMLPNDRFLPGLVSFLVAHVCYIVAFADPAGFYTSLWALIPFLVYGSMIVAFLWPHLGTMKGPATIYVVAILIMAWQALGQWQGTGEARAALAFAGAILFVISDSILALNRFRQPVPNARLWILGTYDAAQWLIALSAGAGHL